MDVSEKDYIGSNDPLLGSYSKFYALCYYEGLVQHLLVEDIVVNRDSRL